MDTADTPDAPKGPRKIEHLNKWIWALSDFSERTQIAVNAVKAGARDGIPAEQSVMMSLHHFMVGPPKVPYPVEHEVIDDLKHALVGVYMETHNFGPQRRRRGDDA